MSQRSVRSVPAVKVHSRGHSGWMDLIGQRLIRRAARGAPESLSQRLEEEWLADFAARAPSAMSRLRFALGCCWATQVIAIEFQPSSVPAAGPAVAGEVGAGAPAPNTTRATSRGVRARCSLCCRSRAYSLRADEHALPYSPQRNSRAAGEPADRQSAPSRVYAATAGPAFQRCEAPCAGNRSCPADGTGSTHCGFGKTCSGPAAVNPTITSPNSKSSYWEARGSGSPIPTISTRRKRDEWMSRELPP